MLNEDKFPAMVPGSRAAELVMIFPPTGINYSQAMSSLKNRFDHNELEVKVNLSFFK